MKLSLQQDKVDAMKTRMDELLKERDTFIHFGQGLEHAGVRQQRYLTSDMLHMQHWFAESFGLVAISQPDYHPTISRTMPTGCSSLCPNDGVIG